MAVNVYPRLGKLLRDAGLPVTELARRIEQRYGLTFDHKTLYRLTRGEAVQRADLEVAGAAALILGVQLDDIFDVRAVPLQGEEEVAALGPRQLRRLAELSERASGAGLSTEDQNELDRLVAEYGRNLYDRRVEELARKRGVPVDEAKKEIEAKVEEAETWWRAFEADPARRRQVFARTRRRTTKAETPPVVG